MKKNLVNIGVVILAVFSIVKIVDAVLAEQIGGSPESGSNSKLTTINIALTALSYGSTAAGTWGNWGTMWNRIYSAGITPFNDALVAGLKNGSGTGTVVGYTKALGGVDDYNNNQTIPTDTYKKTWITCNSSAYTPSNLGGNYCNTGRSVLNNLVSQDPNTNLVWSPSLGTGNWFTANNCQQPSNGVAPLGANACTNHLDVGCLCVKLTSSKTGCDNYDDGLWRLPYQKELMQSYIDGSWGNLASAGANYWSATAGSNSTQNAWFTYQYIGFTFYNTKVTSTYSIRCVR